MIGTARKRRGLKSGIVPLIYVAPACLFMIVFIIVPIVYSIVMSFYYIPGLGTEWKFVSFANFRYILKEKDMIAAFGRTLGFGAFSMGTTLVLGLLLAFLVAGSRRLHFYRYVFYIPGVVSSITMSMIWGQILSPTEFGLLNRVLLDAKVLDAPFTWLNSEKFTWMIVLGIGLIGCGGGMTLIIFTTAINDVSAEIKESAILEGAGPWVLNTRIVLPLIRPQLVSWSVLSIIGSLKSFESIYALTRGGPNDTTTTLAILLFANNKQGIYGYGYSSALGLFMSVIVLAFVGAFNYINKLRDKREES
ncbi:MAG: sugar ABC transporter permease [Clostridia bacterium]|nr:sugar ABC transporter permease [Clostridia bacterium]